MVTYWINVYSEQTWKESQAHGPPISGFAEKRLASVQKIALGDILLCYIMGAKKLTGAREVIGPAFISRTPAIWFTQAYPVRLPVKALVTLDLEEALDFEALLPKLSFYNPGNMRCTWAKLQGSPTRLEQVDGELLLAALRGTDAALADQAVVPGPDQEVPPPPSPAVGQALPAAKAPPALLSNPLDTLIHELLVTQQDATKPTQFEQTAFRAFAYLGFDVQHKGKSGHTDLVLDSPLGTDRYRVVVDVKSSATGKIAESQINFPAIKAHREHEAAHHAAVLGEKFAGGNLQKFATEFDIALIDTPTLVDVLRLHQRTPFTAADLRALFTTAGPVTTALADLKQKAQATERHWLLIAEIVTLVDTFSRLEQPLPLTSGALHAVLVSQSLPSKQQASSPPSEQDVRDALAFLSCRAVGILRAVDPDTAGYRLTMPVSAALQRLRALESAIRAVLAQGSEQAAVVTSNALA